MSRLPTSAQALSSLGAVGGPRGTAAGALRVLVEFITQYDSAAVKQLESDLNDLATSDQGIQQKQLATERALDTLRKRRAQTEKEIARVISTRAEKPSTVRSELREIERIGVLSKEGQKRLTALSKEVTGNKQLADLITRQANIRRAQAANETRLNNLTSVRVGLVEQEAAVQGQLGKFQQLRAGIIPKLGGLAIGALGGIAGGAILGVGFAAAEAALSSIGEKIQDLIDPARHAREVVDDLGQAIRDLAQESGGDLRQAAGDFLAQFGISSDTRTRDILAEAAGIQFANEQLQKRQQLLELLNHHEELRQQLIRAMAIQLAREAGEERVAIAIGDERYRSRVSQVSIDQFLAAAESQLSGAQDQAAASAARAARESQILEAARRNQAAAAQLAAFAEENLVSAISRAAGVRINAFDAQIAGLRESGPSARTRALEAQIEKLQNAGTGGGGQDRARQQELANIAEERALILLRQRLRLMGTNIDLEKYSGKFLLEAINAKLKALQKEAAAQDRLNKLLDLQFRMSQKLRRNEGESITDFLERRAQENRGFLSEQRDIEREVVEERLRELQEKTQDEVSLTELAERRKNSLTRSGADNRIRNLQKELEKSREADRKALQAKIAAVEKAKKAYEEQARIAEKYATVSANAQIREAIRASKKITDLAALTGQITGLHSAKNFLSALLSSGVLTGAEARSVQQAIDRINQTLSAYDRQRDIVIARTGHVPGTRGLRLASGGFIPLNNASSPLGSNVRFGEEGTEAGLLVLPNKIQQALKDARGVGQVGPFTLNGSDNPLRDRYQFKKLVKEAVSEALR